MPEEQELPSEKVWRTLARVVKIKNQMIVIVLPGQSRFGKLNLSTNMFPEEINTYFLDVGCRFHVFCNKGVEDVKDLKIYGLEFDKPIWVKK